MGVARQYSQEVVHYLRKRVNYNDVGVSGGVLVGTVPANSQLVGIHARILTVFNAATTNVLTAGTTPTGAQILTNAESVPGTLGWKTGATGQAVTFAADTDIYASYTQTGTAATTGQADIIISFIPYTNDDRGA